MLNRYCLFFLVVCLISSVHGEDPPPESQIDFICFEPYCETPYFLGVLIADLPELSLFKGTEVLVFAESPDVFRVKVGDATYDVPLSFVEIKQRLHESRGLWRTKLPKLVSLGKESAVPQNLQPPADDKKKEVGDFEFRQDSSISTSPSPPTSSPPVEQKIQKSNYNVSPDSKDSQSTQFSKNIQTEPPVQPLMEAHHKEEIKVISTPEIKQQIEKPGVLKQPVMEKQASDFPHMEMSPQAESNATPVPEIRTMQQAPPAEVKKVMQNEHPHATETTPEVTPAPETMVDDRKPSAEQPPNVGGVEVVDIERQPSVETAPKPVEQPSKVEEVKSENVNLSKHVTRSPPIESIVKKKEAPTIQLSPPAEPVAKSEAKPPIVETSNVEDAKVPEVPVTEHASQPPHAESTEGKEEVVSIQQPTTVESMAKSEEKSTIVETSKVDEANTPEAPVRDFFAQPPHTEPTEKREESTSVEQPPSTEVVAKSEEKPPIAETSKVEAAKTLNVPQGESLSQSPHLETIPKMEEVQQPPEQIIDLTAPQMEEVEETPTPKNEPIPVSPNLKNSATNLSSDLRGSAESPPESEAKHPEIHDSNTQTQLSDELKEVFKEENVFHAPSRLNIENESIFFHCLSLAANGTFNGERSLFAAAILSVTRYYFNAAHTLLGKIPHSLISPLDSLFTFTLKTPLVFFTTWALFVASAIVTYLAAKFINKLLLYGFSSINTDDPTRRSLSQWLAVEENANLLADSLADKEEAYGRLVVWSTKVSERLENQNRHAATSSTHAHNQLRDTKAALAESLKENKELKQTHDALVEQLSAVKSEAALNSAHLRDQISTLNKRLEESTRQYGESIAEKERLNEELMSTLCEEKAVLEREVKRYQSQVESAQKAMNELKEANQRFEEDLAIRDRELLCVKEAFMELKATEFRSKNKKAVVSSTTPLKTKTNEDRASTDGWEVEDDAELDAIIEEVEGNQPEEEAEEVELNESDLQTAFDCLKEVGRLKVALEETEKLAHNAASAKDQETKLRVELEEKVDSLKSEMDEMRQELRTATEEREAARTKLEVLSDYFHKREAERQKDLGRKELSHSEMSEEISLLREKQHTAKVEVNTLREQLSSARRELAEVERANRRRVSELDKRLHENRLASRFFENQVKDLRAENAMLRQKMFVGDRAGVLAPAVIPPPPPPPPPQMLALAALTHPENRPTSRQSDKSLPPNPAQLNHQQQQQPLPHFLPFPLGGPGGGPQFIPPPRPPLGMMPSALLNSKMDPSRSGPRPVSTASGSNQSGKQPR